MRRKITVRTLVLTATLAVVAGGTAIAQQQPQNGYGGVGQRPSNLPTVPEARGPQPAPPPGLVEATRRRAEAAARGEDIPMRVWDPTTGDMMRHPDGSFVWNNELPGYGQPPPHPFGCTAPKGCSR
jgi:hypothetical protein